MRRSRLARPVLLGWGLLCGYGAMAGAGDAPTTVLAADPIETAGHSDAATTFVPVIELTAATGPARGAATDRVEVLQPGTSGRDALSAAKSSLPLRQLSVDDRRRAENILNNLSMFRAMPSLRLQVDHDVYRFFVEHPDVAVSMWRALGVSKCELWQTGPNAYETDIGDGSTGVIDVLLRSGTDHLILGEGEFKSPLIVKPIQATALLHLHTDYVIRRDGETEAITRGSLFVAFPSQTVETAAKVISPVTNMVIDRNFEEIGMFAQMMTVTMRNQPGWIESLAGQLDGILERRRLELLQVTARAYVANRKRDFQREGRPISADLITPSSNGAAVAPAGR